MRKEQCELDWFEGKSRDIKRRPGRIVTKHQVQGGAAAICRGVSLLFGGDTEEIEEIEKQGVKMLAINLRPKEQAIREMLGTDSFTGKIQTLWRNNGLKLPIRPIEYSKAKWNKTVVDVLRKDLPESPGQYQIIYQLNDGGVVGKPEVIKL